MKNTHRLFILALIGAQSLGLSLTASAPAGTKSRVLTKTEQALQGDGEEECQELCEDSLASAFSSTCGGPYLASLTQTPFRMLGCYSQLHESSISCDRDDEPLRLEDSPWLGLSGFPKVTNSLLGWLKTSVKLCTLETREDDLDKVIVNDFKKIIIKLQRTVDPEYLQDIGDYFAAISYKAKEENNIPVLTTNNWKYIRSLVDNTQGIARVQLRNGHEEILKFLNHQILESDTFCERSLEYFNNLAAENPYDLLNFLEKFKSFIMANMDKIKTDMLLKIDELVQFVDDLERKAELVY